MNRRCIAVTRKGDRCRGRPVKDSDRCLAHQDRETRELAGFGGPQPGAGRPPKLHVAAVMREIVEENAEAVLAPYFDTLSGAMMTASYEGEVHVSTVPDLTARVAAAEKLLNRVYGKPRQALEHHGLPDVPARRTDLSKLSDDELDELDRLMEKAKPNGLVPIEELGRPETRDFIGRVLRRRVAELEPGE